MEDETTDDTDPQNPDLLVIARKVIAERKFRIPRRLMDDDELVNEAWIAAKIAVGKCPAETLNVAAYARQSARNHMLRIAKRENAHDRRQSTGDDSVYAVIDHRTPDLCSTGHIDRDDRRRLTMNPSESVAVLFHKFFGSLPDELKQPAYLRFVREMTDRKIAKTLGVSKSTINRRITEALSIVRDNASKKLWDKSGEMTHLLMGTDHKTTNPRKTNAAV